jgi:hypothetical protein
MACNNSNCGCRAALLIACCPETETLTYEFENANLTGIGVLDGVSSQLVSFRGIVSEALSLTVSLNAADNTIVLDFDADLLVADLPQATTTQRGVGETATDAEAIAKASTTVFITPSNFAAMGSSTTFAGLVELATNAETQAGVSTTLAVTPAGLASATALLTTIQTWNDAVARAAATPDYDGQLGVQLDTNIPYVADGGQFNLPMLVLQNANNAAATDPTFIDLTGSSSFVFSSTDSTGIVAIDSNVTFSVLGVLNMDTGGRLHDAGVIVPASSVLTTSSTAGQFNSSLISTFVSAANVQTYGLPTSTLARTTFATYAGQAISNPPTQAEVQALDNAVVIVSQRLGALITDLMATLKPHA